MVDHAVRCWEAERENAQRIESRRQLIAGAVVAVLGLGFFKFEWAVNPAFTPTVTDPYASLAIRTLLALAIGLFASALFALFRTPRKPHLTASYRLAVRREDADQPFSRVAFLRTYKAYLALQRGNARQWTRLKNAERLFGAGGALILTAMVLYLFFGAPAILG